VVVLGDPANFSRIERCKIDRTYIIIVIIKFYQHNGYQKKKDTSTDNSTNAHALSHTIQILIYKCILRSKFGKLPNWRCLCNLVVHH